MKIKLYFFFKCGWNNSEIQKDINTILKKISTNKQYTFENINLAHYPEVLPFWNNDKWCSFSSLSNLKKTNSNSKNSYDKQTKKSHLIIVSAAACYLFAGCARTESDNFFLNASTFLIVHLIIAN